MKRKLIALSQGYAKALSSHLKQSSRTTLRVARELGRAAVILGIETLDLARIHEQAMTALDFSGHKNRAAKRAEIFFNEANTLIEETHCAVNQNNVHLNQLQKTLGRRTKELAVTNRQLRRGVVRRKVVEVTFAKTGKQRRKCLEESLDLQKRLRQLTHQILAAQENERRKVGGELQDEIVQTLLGINVRLLSLKRGDRSNTEDLRNEIASAQRLVLQSAQAVRQFARELGSHHPGPGKRSLTRL